MDNVAIWEPFAIAEFSAKNVPNLRPTEPRAHALGRFEAFQTRSEFRSINLPLAFDETRRVTSTRPPNPSEATRDALAAAHGSDSWQWTVSVRSILPGGFSPRIPRAAPHPELDRAFKEERAPISNRLLRCRR